MRFLLRIMLVFSLVAASSVMGFAQVRIAVFPFTNNGNSVNDEWRFKLQDSLAVAFAKSDLEGKNYQVVPKDSVEMAFAQLKLNPKSPEFSIEMWKAVEKLNVTRVISGYYNLELGKFLINAYIYHVDNQLPDPDFQAVDIFKKEEAVYDAIPIIVRQLRKAFVKS